MKIKAEPEEVFQSCVGKTISNYVFVEGKYYDTPNEHFFFFSDGSSIGFRPKGCGYNGEIWNYDIQIVDSTISDKILDEFLDKQGV